MFVSSLFVVENEGNDYIKLNCFVPRTPNTEGEVCTMQGQLLS